MSDKGLRKQGEALVKGFGEDRAIREQQKRIADLEARLAKARNRSC